jgi:dihydrodipicolinate synthase/N-acetylneuraminate lyase
MSESLSCSWSGVFPAATTQFDPALQVDLPTTQRVQAALLQDGVHGLVLMGTVGEGNSLSPEEKRRVLEAAVEVSGGKAPEIRGSARCWSNPIAPIVHSVSSTSTMSATWGCAAMAPWA